MRTAPPLNDPSAASAPKPDPAPAPVAAHACVVEGVPAPCVAAASVRTALCLRTCWCRDPLRERGILRCTELTVGTIGAEAGWGFIAESGGRSRSTALLAPDAGPEGIVSAGSSGAALFVRRMNGDGQSGSSADHLAGVASGR